MCALLTGLKWLNTIEQPMINFKGNEYFLVREKTYVEYCKINLCKMCLILGCKEVQKENGYLNGYFLILPLLDYTWIIPAWV